MAKMKLSEIGTVLMECKRELSTLSQRMAESGETTRADIVEEIYFRASKAREAIENKEVEID